MTEVVDSGDKTKEFERRTVIPAWLTPLRTPNSLLQTKNPSKVVLWEERKGLQCLVGTEWGVGAPLPNCSREGTIKTNPRMCLI